MKIGHYVHSGAIVVLKLFGIEVFCRVDNKLRILYLFEIEYHVDRPE